MDSDSDSELELELELDCRVTVRDYVLVANPSKLARKGDRQVVQSPMLDITNMSTKQLVPVRCFRGIEENVVCYLPKGDIEKDSSIAYRKAFVSTVPKIINAHGIALCDSEDGFEYKRGDHFWIISSGNPKEGEVEVPVINLENYKTGIIPISHVCWVPRVLAPGKEFWTFGGGAMEIRQAGPKNIKKMTWMICQDFDGKRATTKLVSTPSKAVGTTDQRWLSSSESRCVFSRVLRKKNEADNALRVRRMHTSTSGGEISPWWSPSPSQFDATDLIDSIECPAGTSISEAEEMQGSKTTVQRKSKRLQDRKRKASPVPASRVREKRRRISSDEDEEGDYIFNDSVQFDQLDRLERSISPSPTLEHEFSGTPMLARTLGQKQTPPANGKSHQRPNDNKLAFCASDPALIRDPTRIAELYHANKAKSNPRAIAADKVWNSSQCNQQLEECKFSTRWTQYHYHLDPTKCRRPFDIKHEHCISLCESFPGPRNPCLLVHNDHFCCIWNDVDRAAMPEVPGFKYSDAKQREEKGRVIDMSKGWDKLAASNRQTEDSVVLFGNDPSNQAGIDFLKDMSEDETLAGGLEEVLRNWEKR
jgi:hypothetical protein